MALTGKQKERMDKLDFGKGGGFSDFITDRQKLLPADSQFLFVGLGGKGSSIVASIKTGVYQKIVCNEDTMRPDNFEYLAIDTDMQELAKLVEGGFGEIGLSGSPVDVETCQLFDSTAAARLKPDRRHLIPANITDWLNPTMNQELQGRGAGGIRQAGRYLLFSEAFNPVRNTLTLKLRKLHSQINNTATQKLIVYIFAGIGGGTGSGTIIDIPYIIREICREYNWKIKIYSYIFLPDTYAGDGSRQTHVKYNSYAALKEINTLMNIGQMNGAAHFRAKYASDFEVDSTERIFDSCILVSGKKIDGMVANPDKFSKKVVVDNIINLVTRNVTDEGFLANSFLDNSDTMIKNAVNALDTATVPKDEYYQYTVIGTGALELPIEQILAYIAHGTMDKLAEAWDQHAQQQDVEGVLSRIQMKPQDFSGAIIGKSKVSLMQYSKGIGGQVSKAQIIDNTLFNIIRQYWMGQNVALYDAWDEAKNLYLEFVIRQLSSNYYTVFINEDQGIYFLKELLSFRVVEGHDFNGIYQRISEEYMASITGLISGQQQIQIQIDQRMREIKGELEAPLCLFPNKLIEEYRELCVNRLICENMIEMYDVIVRDCLKQVIEFLRVKINKLQTYIDVFTYMRSIVEQNYRSVMEGTMPLTEYAGRLVDFSMTGDETTRKVIAYMDNMIADKNPKGLVTALEADLIAEENKWTCSDESFNPMLVFVDFLMKQYQQLPDLTIEKFIRLKYGEDGFDNGMQEVCQELKNKAEVIFPADPIISLSDLASKPYVVIPAGALDITRNMAAFAAANGATVAHSNDMRSMYWYNLVIGVPMFLLKDIQEYEKLYEVNDSSGVHCWESSTVNWKDWPALYNRKLWATPDWNIREKKFTEEVQMAVKEYLACGLIRQDGNRQDEKDLYYAFCMPVGDSSITKSTILEWCREQYLAEPDYSVDGRIDAGKDFVGRMISAQGFKKYLVTIPNVYMEITEESLYKLIRMNIFLYRMLQDVYEIYTECRQMIEQANDKADKEKKLREKNKIIRNNMQRFYDYVRTGIVTITDDAVFLEYSNGEQEEIMYFDDYSGLENQFYVYTAFNIFMEKFEEEVLEELDEFREELSKDRSDEARSKYQRLSDSFIDSCTETRNMLKKFETKKRMEKSGQKEMINVYAEFYDTFIEMKKGR